MHTFIELLQSPVGPPTVLLVGAIVQILCGRWVRQAIWLTGLALVFVGLAGLLWLSLALQPQVPVYSQPWQPLLQSGANLYWVGDGWNWYISGLILLLGGLGILLALNSEGIQQGRRIHGALAINLAVIAASLLFVGSGNLLTAILTWVMVDLFALVRSATHPDAASPTALATSNIQAPGAQGLFGTAANAQEDNYARGLSLVGAMLLLIALLPAGPTGPGQEFVSGHLPYETIYLMAIAAAIRAGIYPFHLWLLSNQVRKISVSERLLEHLVPALSGLWLLGWTFNLGAPYIALRYSILTVLLLALLGSATAAWTAQHQSDRATLVLITSAGLAALTGALAYTTGPSAMIWATTAFALGGGLWLVGEQVWQGWGWQIPVSVGALTLTGVPFTPGFLSQPALARLLMRDIPLPAEHQNAILGVLAASPALAFGLPLLLFGLYVVAQTLQIAALLRRLEEGESLELPQFNLGAVIRLFVACIAIGLPLAIVGFIPSLLAAMANLPNAIPPTLGNPPNVVAELPVWVTLGLPLLAGLSLVWLRPKTWLFVGVWPTRINRVVRLEWLFSFGWWAANRASAVWWNALRVFEGAGYMGWLVVILLIGYLLIH